MAHHTAPVPEAGERHIGVLAILHCAMDIIDAINLGVSILKTQRPEQVFVFQRVKRQRVGFRGKEIDDRRTVQPEVFCLKRQIG